MPLPSSVTVGAITYAIANDAATYGQTVVDFNEQTWGRVQHSLNRIVLEPTQGEAHRRVALLHEVLHACWHLTDPLDPHDAEEFAVRTITGPLLDVLRRNPELVAYLLEDTHSVSLPSAP